MFDWSKVKDKTAIHCKTEREADAFLRECEEHGIRWCTGARATDYVCYKFSRYGEKTTFFFENNEISFGDSAILYGHTLIEFSDLCKADLPRICYVLGGEDNPMKIGEEFEVEGYCHSKLHVEPSGVVLIKDRASEFGRNAADSLQEAINHPEKIIRHPQFSEDEKALMRLYVKAGKPIFKPNNFDDRITAWDKDEIKGNGIPKGILPQITDRFDAAAYLESEDTGK